METATNAVVEGQMSPISAAPITQQTTCTGQWMFDTFVNPQQDAGNISRMNAIRLLAVTAVDADIKLAFKDAIEIAHKHDIKAGIAEKVRGPKRQAAMNVRSVVQNIYGALRKAKDELVSLGYDDNTGYLQANTMAKQALDKKGIKWNGSPKPSEEQRALAQVARERQEKRDALNTVQSENVQGDGESDVDYFVRMKVLADELLLESRKEAQGRVASKVVVDLVGKHGRDVAMLILERLQAFLTQTQDMTDEQADAALQAAGEEEAMEEAAEAE